MIMLIIIIIIINYIIIIYYIYYYNIITYVFIGLFLIALVICFCVFPYFKWFKGKYTNNYKNEY